MCLNHCAWVVMRVVLCIVIDTLLLGFYMWGLFHVQVTKEREKEISDDEAEEEEKEEKKDEDDEEKEVS